MKIKDLISMALKNLSSRKLRTFLTVLGVVIGTTSIIVTLSLGFGLQKTQENFIKSMGDLTTLDIHENYASDGNDKIKKLNKQAVSELKKLDHIDAVMPMINANGKLKSGRYTYDYANIVAINPDSMEKFGYKIDEGRLLNSSDKNVVVLGGGVAKSFTDEKRPSVDVSEKIKPMKSKIELSLESSSGHDSNNSSDNNIYSEKIKVAGVLTDNDNDWENNTAIFMPIDYLKKLEKSSKTNLTDSDRKNGEFSNIKVKVDDIKNVKAVQDSIKGLGYQSSGMTDWLESTKKQARIFQAIFGGIGAISFLVAAIGITNTMIMSIYERTREIGVMKVIGASISDIEKLFLTEAGFIGFMGGICGVVFSFILSFIFNIVAKGFLLNMIGSDDMSLDAKISVIPIWLIIVAVIFSTLIGVLSGYLPAKRAMKLSALDAIRSE